MDGDCQIFALRIFLNSLALALDFDFKPLDSAFPLVEPGVEGKFKRQVIKRRIAQFGVHSQVHQTTECDGIQTQPCQFELFRKFMMKQVFAALTPVLGLGPAKVACQERLSDESRPGTVQNLHQTQKWAGDWHIVCVIFILTFLSFSFYSLGVHPGWSSLGRRTNRVKVAAREMRFWQVPREISILFKSIANFNECM